LLAVVVGCAVAAIPTLLQPHFKAGSLPELICEIFLLPGELLATPFKDRGTASPEFLWRSRIATVIVFGGLAYLILRHRHQKNS
jgi:hypothetical protein